MPLALHFPADVIEARRVTARLRHGHVPVLRDEALACGHEATNVVMRVAVADEACTDAVAAADFLDPAGVRVELHRALELADENVHVPDPPGREGDPFRGV